MQFARSKDKIKYLEYVAIDDNRTTEICKKLDGTRLPPDDPFWASHTPPNHFNCRSTVRAIFKGTDEAKRVKKRKPKDVPPIPEGFAASPLESWWKPTDSMAKRVVKYGLKDEVLERAKRMCGKNFEDWECPEFEQVKRILDAYGESWETLRRVLGENRKAPVKIGDIVPAGISGWGKTRVVKIYKDLLGNEIWATEFNLEHIGLQKKRLLSPATIKLILPYLFRNPDLVIYDRYKDGAIHYGRVKRIKNEELYVFAVVGHQSLRFLTVIDKKQLYDKINDRYWVLWRKQ